MVALNDSCAVYCLSPIKTWGFDGRKKDLRFKKIAELVYVYVYVHAHMCQLWEWNKGKTWVELPVWFYLILFDIKFIIEFIYISSNAWLLGWRYKEIRGLG